MNTQSIQRSIFALFAVLALALAGCGGTNNTPPGTDGGRDAAAVADTGATPDSGHDGGAIGDDSGLDAGPDTGPCVSTIAHCNTCVTAATDPLNACSSYVTGCIAFDNTRVPGWPDHIPAVTP